MLYNHCIHALRRKLTDHFPELSESDIKCPRKNVKTNLVIEWYNNY